MKIYWLEHYERCRNPKICKIIVAYLKSHGSFINPFITPTDVEDQFLDFVLDYLEDHDFYDTYDTSLRIPSDALIERFAAWLDDKDTLDFVKE